VPDKQAVRQLNYLVVGGCLYFYGACHQVLRVVAPPTLCSVLTYVYRLVPVCPSIHIRLLNDNKMHQMLYENDRNVSMIAYITYQ